MYVHLIWLPKNTWRNRVDYVNFCFAYVISLLHNSRQNKKATTKSACTHTILLWSAAAICRKPCCLQVENYTPNMAHALITSTHVCLQSNDSATVAFIRSLHLLLFCCSERCSRERTLQTHRHRHKKQVHPMIWPDVSIQLCSRSNRFIMLTFHAYVPRILRMGGPTLRGAPWYDFIKFFILFLLNVHSSFTS